MSYNGKNNKGGNPGYGVIQFIMRKVEQFSPKWWSEWEIQMNGEDKESKRFAMEQFNKIQMKFLPQEVKFEDKTPRLELPKEDITLLTWLAQGLRERLKNQECLPSPKSESILPPTASTDSSNSITSKRKKVMT